MTTDTRDEEPLAWCPGCGDRIPTEVIRERGVCSNCHGTSDDPWAAGRPSTDQALAEAWAEGHRTGWEHCQDGNYGNDHWDDPTPNPYAAAARAETTDERVVHNHGPTDGPGLDCPETILPDGGLREARVCYTDECGEPCRSHVASLWAERDAARKAAGVVGERLGKERAKVAEVQAQRDALAAKVAAVEALVSEWERVQEQNRTALGELARGATHLLLDTPGPADFRAALSAAPTDTTKETDR